MSRRPLAPPLWFGGDYNPEQWPSDVWQEDIDLMVRAGVTMATVGVFSWAALEPSDGRFDFEWLDDVLERLEAAGIGVDLATGTASPPPWLTHEHPDVLPVTRDGVTLGSGSRQQYSPSSSTYRRYATRLTRAMAERYGTHGALRAWHVNNEYGCHVSRSYDRESAAAFRNWLRERYGSIDGLNDAWGTAFWSQRYGSFDEIEPPRAAPTTLNPTQVLDFDRFSSDALLELFRSEAAILREVTPDVPITTNFMGLFGPLDYWRWARELDFVSDDSYPDPADPDAPLTAALSRDLMRSLGHGKPWVLMEQAPSAVNWRGSNRPKPPGWNRSLALQAVARGADGVMHFQWRQSRKGAEKFHSALLPHAGANTRVYEEAAELGHDLRRLGDIAGTKIHARTAIVLDWDSWWTLQQEAMPANLDYAALLTDWYQAFWRRGERVDFVPTDGPFDAYDTVVVPALVTVTDEDLSRLAAVAEDGKTLIVTFQTGVLDPTLGVHRDGYLGPLAKHLGIRLLEFAPTGNSSPKTSVTGTVLGHLDATNWQEHLELAGAVLEATFDDGWLAGSPAVTRRETASGGDAWYIATQLTRDSIARLLDTALGAADPTVVRLHDAGIELIDRGRFRFIINHSASTWAGKVDDIELMIPAWSTQILENPTH
ncbi:MAG: beta-galactosidase [Rhodococcus sp. (in: high G+C Gram-positive bacteria)]